MKTVIETTFGKQENREVILNDINLKNVGHHEEHEALKKGFLFDDITDGGIWYMSRSTRVCVAETNYEEYNEQWEIVEELTPKYLNRLEQILNKYIKKHNFKDFSRTLSPSDRCKFFIYYQNKWGIKL